MTQRIAYKQASFDFVALQLVKLSSMVKCRLHWPKHNQNMVQEPKHSNKSSRIRNSVIWWSLCYIRNINPNTTTRVATPDTVLYMWWSLWYTRNINPNTTTRVATPGTVLYMWRSLWYTRNINPNTTTRVATSGTVLYMWWSLWYLRKVNPNTTTITKRVSYIWFSL